LRNYYHVGLTILVPRGFANAAILTITVTLTITVISAHAAILAAFSFPSALHLQVAAILPFFTAV
jgi:hypothetical protein